MSMRATAIRRFLWKQRCRLSGAPPRSRNRELFRRAMRRPAPFASHGPVDLFLEITNACNLHCIMCRSHPTLSGAARHMDRGIVDRLRQVLAAADRIFSNGWGEPFAFPGFLSLLAAIRGCNPSAEIWFNTNGQLITEGTASELVERRVTTICLSIDAAEPRLYESIRRGASFDRLVRAIRCLNERKRNEKSSHPALIAEAVVMRSNIEYLEGIAAFCAEHAFSGLVLERVRGYPDLDVGDFTPHASALRAVMLRAQRSGLALSGPLVDECRHLFEGTPPPLSPCAAASASAIACIRPWHTALVRTDGTVLPCCIAGPVLGDLREESFDAVWNGAVARGLRECMISGRHLPACADCIRSGRHTPPAAVPV